MIFDISYGSEKFWGLFEGLINECFRAISNDLESLCTDEQFRWNSMQCSVTKWSCHKAIPVNASTNKIVLKSPPIRYFLKHCNCKSTNTLDKGCWKAEDLFSIILLWADKSPNTPFLDLVLFSQLLASCLNIEKS